MEFRIVIVGTRKTTCSAVFRVIVNIHTRDIALRVTATRQRTRTAVHTSCQRTRTILSARISTRTTVRRICRQIRTAIGTTRPGTQAKIVVTHTRIVAIIYRLAGFIFLTFYAATTAIVYPRIHASVVTTKLSLHTIISPRRSGTRNHPI